jgi:hypothetical protein
VYLSTLLALVYNENITVPAHVLNVLHWINLVYIQTFCLQNVDMSVSQTFRLLTGIIIYYIELSHVNLQTIKSVLLLASGGGRVTVETTYNSETQSLTVRKPAASMAEEWTIVLQ